MPGIGEEVGIFLGAVLSGTVVFASYQILRVFRRLQKHNLMAIAIEDFLFWIGTAVYLFCKIYQTSDGNIRWFFVVGALVGAGMLFLLCRWTKKVANRLFR
ncbi:MAG: spore cortex biosynthesis protein YabQ [Lachnospiraceae bacterium]